jgi:hypothetical protein
LIGAKKRGRQREEIAGMTALGFVVVSINRQVALVRSMILRNACWASLVRVWASSKTMSLKSASSGRSAAYYFTIYLKFVSRLSCFWYRWEYRSSCSR